MFLFSLYIIISTKAERNPECEGFFFGGVCVFFVRHLLKLLTPFPHSLPCYDYESIARSANPSNVFLGENNVERSDLNE